jgi:hypothetical protein
MEDGLNLHQLVLQEMVQAERRLVLIGDEKKQFVIDAAVALISSRWGVKVASKYIPLLEEIIEFIISISKNDAAIDIIKQINQISRCRCLRF